MTHQRFTEKYDEFASIINGWGSPENTAALIEKMKTFVEHCSGVKDEHDSFLAKYHLSRNGSNVSSAGATLYDYSTHIAGELDSTQHALTSWKNFGTDETRFGIDTLSKFTTAVSQIEEQMQLDAKRYHALADDIQTARGSIASFMGMVQTISTYLTKIITEINSAIAQMNSKVPPKSISLRKDNYTTIDQTYTTLNNHILTMNDMLHAEAKNFTC